MKLTLKLIMMKKITLLLIAFISINSFSQVLLEDSYGKNGIKSKNEDTCGVNGDGNRVTQISTTEYSIDWGVAMQSNTEVRISLLVGWDESNAEAGNADKVIDPTTLNGSSIGFHSTDTSTEFTIERIEELNGAEACWSWNRRIDCIVKYNGPADAVLRNVILVFNEGQTIKTKQGNNYNEIKINLAYKPTLILNVEDVEKNRFSFSPNPANTHINVTATQTIDSVELLNSIGQKVSSTFIGATSGKVDVSNVASGVYILRTMINGAASSQRVVIE